MTFNQVGLVTEPELDFPESSCEFLFFFLSTKYFLPWGFYILRESKFKLVLCVCMYTHLLSHV